MRDAVAYVEIARLARVLLAVPEAPAHWLSESEWERLAGLRHDARRAQYLTGHWLARVLLARAHGGEPAHWRLRERRGLPPQAQGLEDVMRISISHSGDWIAVAVATVPIGIDLEQRPRVLDAAIEPLLLNADEAPGSVDSDNLLQRWVAKEAWIKRQAESALPERLAQLQLRPIARDHAEVRIDSHAGLHVALSIDPGCDLRRQSEVTLTPGGGFSVVDPRSPVGLG